MKILNQNRTKIINLDKLVSIEMEYNYGENEEFNTIKSVSLIVTSFNTKRILGIYETQDRARKILLDIFSELKENKKYYTMPEK